MQRLTRDSLGPAMLAATACLVLADAAIETCWSGFALRWPVVAVSVALLAVIAWLWRPGGKLPRFGPGGAATAAVGGLLALLAFTPWQQGGQADGVRLLLQPTPVVLALASICGVLLSVVVISEALAPLHPGARFAARGAIALLGAYAIAALALAARGRPAAFSDLFAGRAVWSSLPAGLQGTFVGVFVLVPMAVLGQAGRLWRYRRSGESPWALLRQGIALVLIFVMALPGLGTSGPGPAPAARDQTAPMLWQPGVDQLDKLFRAAEALSARLDRTTFDPQAVVAKVGTSADGLFEWVRDNTSWVPYAGALRGPAGVLMDRLGNSLDRSLLLAALLKAAGHEVRLAHAQLPADLARSLLPHIRPVPPSAESGRPDFRQLAAGVDRVAREFGLDADGMRRNLAVVESRASIVQTELARRIAAQSEMVLRTLGQRAVGSADTAGKGLAALADHWWVQRREQDAWVDLDPLLPDAAPRAAHAAVGETLELPNDAGAIPLDSRFCHEVEIRIVAEQWKDGALSEHIALAHSLRPAEVLGRRLEIQQHPLNWPGTGDPAPSAGLRRLAANAAAVEEWVPALAVGDAIITQRRIGIDGEVREPKGQEGSGMPSPAAGAAGGLFDAFGGGEEERQATDTQPRPQARAASGGRLTAEWVDFVVRVPGQAPRTVRREVLDLLGPAARAEARRGTAPASLEHPGLRLLDRIELLVQAGRYSPEYVADAFSRRLLAQQPEILRLSAGAALEKTIPISPALLNVAIGRFAGKNESGDVYLDCPNILSYRTGVRARASTAGFDSVFDIVSNPVAPAAAKDPAIAFRARVEQGVRDSVVEALVPLESVPGASAAAIFDEAAVAGIKPVLFGGTGGRAPSGIDALAGAAARIREAVESGHLLVAPARPVKLGDIPRMCWYRVDPASGDTVGVLDTGFNGLEQPEYATTVKRVSVDGTAAVSYVGAGAAESTVHSLWIDFLFWCIQHPGAIVTGFSGAATVVEVGVVVSTYVDHERYRRHVQAVRNEEDAWRKAEEDRKHRRRGDDDSFKSEMERQGR